MRNFFLSGLYMAHMMRFLIHAAQKVLCINNQPSKNTFPYRKERSLKHFPTKKHPLASFSGEEDEGRLLEIIGFASPLLQQR